MRPTSRLFDGSATCADLSVASGGIFKLNKNTKLKDFLTLLEMIPVDERPSREGGSLTS